MKRILCAVFAIFTFWCGTSSAVTFCQATTGTTLVVFGNGIMNSKDDAKKSLNRLETRLKATLTPTEFNNLSFDLAYNQSYGAMSDLYESLKQKMATDNVALSFWRWLEGSETVPATVRDEMMRINAQFDFSTRVGTADLNNHITLYRSKILEGKKVVVVSHSQGNFFANSAYAMLYGGTTPVPANSFGIVSVANPASYVGGGGPYTTVSEDIVIAAIAVATPPGVLPPLAPNATNSGSGAVSHDWKGHGFLEHYMATGSNTILLITQNVVAMTRSLVTPPQTVQSGIITATLTWGAQPDVDLHAFEPGGSHVYYANRQGVSGHLDLDDTSGYGPEHYYADCSLLQVGTYSIGVNYYNGIGPETAQVQINAGTIVRNYTIPLSTPLASAGNANPTPVASITVSGDAINGYQFTVVGATPTVTVVAF